MIRSKWFHYILLVKRLAFILLLFQLSRLAFIAVNPETATDTFKSIFLASLRYDITAIFIINSLIILMQLFPGPYQYQPYYQQTIGFLLILLNGIALLFNVIDTAWFSYIQKRSTADVFAFIAGGEDVSNNLLIYIMDYWYLLVFWLLLLFSMIGFEKRIRLSIRTSEFKSTSFFSLPIRLVLFILLTGISIIGFRGGVQLKPLSVQSAAKLVHPSSIPLVLNTPYTIIKSWNDQILEEPDLLPIDTAEKIFQVHHPATNGKTLQAYNIVVVIMESFSFEHISYYHPEGIAITPFLDSLLLSSHAWPNTFANAKRSIDGIPAVISSIPALMDQAFINSAYNVNNINSLASLLKPFGYRSGFFHGGNNGTMGFDNFARLAGYDHYYGKNEYDGPANDYDGHWGIYDHAYFSFMIRQLNLWNEPFHAAFFSISSHHPYKIPEKYRDRIDLKMPPIQQGMTYADAALRSFFNEAKMQPWYKNTLFVITSDHSGPAGTPYSANRLGAYHIPLVFIIPGDSTPKVHWEIAQQCDVLPSVLQLIHYPGKYSAFGRDLFASSKGWSVNYSNNSWQLITDELILQFDGQESSHLYRRRDHLLKKNLLKKGDPSIREQERFLKAVLQQYRYGLIHNQLVRP